MSRNTDLLDQWCLASSHGNLFAYHLRRFPLPLVLIVIGVLRVKFLDVQVFNIGDRVCDAPGDMLFVPDYYARCPRETCANYIDISSDEVTLVPDRWHRLPQMRVIAEDG